jgi:3-oxoacyl-[acyl-carrier protein] reductase
VRNVIVTGGSRGIGFAIARKLASSGYRAVAIGRRSNEELARAIEQVRTEASGALEFIGFDLAEIDGIPALVKSARDQFGPIYGLVNNAGISFEGALAMLPTPQIEQLVRINTLSPMVFTKAVVRSMMADRSAGRIVNVSSITAFTGYSGLSVYGATKASMVAFARALSREVGRLGICVNAVAPGFIDTELTRGLDEEHRERIKRRSALQRLACVEDVANAVEFLMSESARSITGTVLTVDAGSTA